MKEKYKYLYHSYFARSPSITRSTFWMMRFEFIELHTDKAEEYKKFWRKYEI